MTRCLSAQNEHVAQFFTGEVFRSFGLDGGLHAAVKSPGSHMEVKRPGSEDPGYMKPQRHECEARPCSSPL